MTDELIKEPLLKEEQKPTTAELPVKEVDKKD